MLLNFNKYKKLRKIFNYGATAFFATLVFSISCVSYVDTVIPKIKITINGADQAHPITGAPAKELWAATTRYETKGYEFEKIKLEKDPKRNGTYKGYLPIKTGSGSVSVIVWDDREQYPLVYGGSPYAPYSRNHKVAETKGFFTPCAGFIQNATGTPLYQYLVGPSKLNAFASGTTLTTGGVSTEVYYSVSNVSTDSNVSAGYLSFSAPTANHCKCFKPVTFMTSLYQSVSLAVAASDWLAFPYAYHFSGPGTTWLSNTTRFRANVFSPVTTATVFTDTNGSLAGGACVARIK